MEVNRNIEKDFFKKVYEIIEEEFQSLISISKTGHDIDTIIKEVKRIKRVTKNRILREQRREDFILSDNFFIDGAIKINLYEINKKYREVLGDYTYRRGSYLIFRNYKYYFLYEGLKVSGVNKDLPINKYKVEDIYDMNKIILGITKHYNDASKLMIKVINDKDLNEIVKRKILLGLIDAKQNILAFILNILFITRDKNFLNEKYRGELVFKKNEIIGLKKVLGNKINVFKIKVRNLSVELIGKLLEEYSNIYIDLLFWDKENGIKRLLKLEQNQTNLLIDKYLKDSIGSLLEIVDEYINNYTKRDTFKCVRKRVIQKLYRIYREENDPLIMIKTAINTFLKFKLLGSKNDVAIVRFVNINYGGILLGSYVKAIFEKLNKGIGVQVGYITYSLYDLKNKINADDVALIVEYPVYNINIISILTKLELLTTLEFDLEDNKVCVNKKQSISQYEKLLDKKIEEKIKNSTLMIVFDDNTYSGSTLNDVRKMLEQDGIKNIILAPTRANFDISKYNKNIPNDVIINILKMCGIELKKSKILNYKKNKNKYNEAVATIIGRIIYKDIFKRLNN